jgi:hypothetical protein
MQNRTRQRELSWKRAVVDPGSPLHLAENAHILGVEDAALVVDDVALIERSGPPKRTSDPEEFQNYIRFDCFNCRYILVHYDSLVGFYSQVHEHGHSHRSLKWVNYQGRQKAMEEVAKMLTWVSNVTKIREASSTVIGHMSHTLPGVDLQDILLQFPRFLLSTPQRMKTSFASDCHRIYIKKKNSRAAVLFWSLVMVVSTLE